MSGQEAQIEYLLKLVTLYRTLDLGYVRKDLGLVSRTRSQIAQMEDEGPQYITDDRYNELKSRLATVRSEMGHFTAEFERLLGK